MKSSAADKTFSSATPSPQNKASATAKAVACALATCLLAVMAPELAEALNPDALLAAAGIHGAIGTVAADIAVLILLALAAFVMLFAIRNFSNAFGFGLDLAFLESRACARAYSVLLIAGLVFAAVLALFGVLDAIFSLMVDRGLDAALSVTCFLGFGLACAVVIILCWLITGLTRRELGGIPGAMQAIFQSGSLVSYITIFLSIALAPVLLIAAVISAGFIASAAIAVVITVMLIVSLPFMFMILAASEK